MTELIKITEYEDRQAVSARELYEFLKIKSSFTTWIKRMFEYDFVENIDFIPFLEESSGGRPSQDYVLTIDCAKEISMLQRTEKGKQARRYFIECERRLKEGVKPLSTIDILELTIKGLRENQQDLQEVKQEIKELKAKTTTRPEYFTIAGYGTLNGIHINIKEAQSLGQKASRICKEKGIPTDETPDPRFGKVKMYPKEVLEKVFAMAIN